MKKIFFLLILKFAIQQSMYAQCNDGAYTVTGNAAAGRCVITGDLTINNGATLNVDYTKFNN